MSLISFSALRRHMILLIAAVVCLLLLQPADRSTVYALAPEGGFATEEAAPVELIRPVAQGSVAFVYCPDLTWDGVIEAWRGRIDSTSSEEKPGSVTSMVGYWEKAGFANLSAHDDPGVSDMLAKPGVGLYRCSDGLTAAQTLESIRMLVEEELPANTTLVIVGSPVFDGGAPNPELTPVIILNEAYSGYLDSEITHRKGMITVLDLLTLQVDVENTQAGEVVAEIDGFTQSTLTGLATTDDATRRADALARESTTIHSMQETKENANLGFLVFVFMSFGLSILLLILGKQESFGSRKVLIPTVRILLLLVLSYPSATILMFTFLPARPSGNTLLIALLIWIAIIATAALLFGRHTTKWVYSLFALFGLTILLVVLGQLLPGPLNAPGYLTYNITEGGRYYGMGNEQAAMLFGSWITLSGLLINRYPDNRYMPLFKKWGFSLGSLALLFLATSPWLGASFGPLVWGFTGCFICWWLFNGRRLRWWMAISILIAAFVLALTVLYVDVALNPASHMNHVAFSMSEGLPRLISSIASDVWSYSLGLIRNHVPPVAILFFALIVVFLLALRVFKPGTYKEFWQRNAAFQISYTMCFALAALTFLIEDSGIFTPAVLIIYPVSGFIWLICDLHSWHLRALEEDGLPLTLKQLQQRAMELLTPKENRHRDGRRDEDKD